jgi:GNAT superfamily N-acetyltransferase
MDLTIAPLDAKAAGVDRLRECFGLLSAAAVVDMPDSPPLTYEGVVGRLTTPLPGRGPSRHWAAERGGQLAGLVTVGFPDAENEHLAMTEVVVHPDLRRRGIGTAMLRSILPVLRADDRQLVEGWGLTKGGAGARWATALGFRVVHGDVLQALVIAEVDPVRWAVQPPAGYRFVRWVDAAPEELVTSYATVRGDIHDAPQEQSSYQFPDWTVDRVRRMEADVRTRKVMQWSVAAVDPDGATAAFTEMEFHLHRPEFGYQGDTVVRRARRGLGLGRCVKAEMMHWIRTERPQVERIVTSTADTNIHMIEINHQLGYRTMRVMVDVENEVDALESRLRH